MPYEVSEYPQVYLNELDKILTHETYSGKYHVQGAEFVDNRTVNVPDLVIPDDAVNDYDRFKTENDVKLNYTPYQLGYDKEEVFYVDAVDDRDSAGLVVSNAVAEYQRLVLNPYIDKQFFRCAASKALDGDDTAITSSNVKAQLRKVRKQFLQAGLQAGDLYVTSDTKAALEDATNRQWGSDGRIYDVIGVYDGFSLIEVPDSTLGCDFLAITGGQSTIRHIIKRAVAYLWPAGTHTQGDGWLAQLRWVFGDIVRKNRMPGIYVHSASGLILPEHDGSPANPLKGLVVSPMAADATLWGHTIGDLQSGIAVGDGYISGTLKKVTSGALANDWGAGWFIALDFSGLVDPDVTVKVGLDPSRGSGLVELDEDMNGIFKVSDKGAQKFVVYGTDGVHTATRMFELSGLALED